MRIQMRKHFYFRELAGSTAIYTAMLILAIKTAPAAPDGWERIAVWLSPMAGFLLILWALIRRFQRSDEYLRRVMLENVAMAAVLTGGLSFTYGFLENAGFPRLSMFAVWPMLAGASILVQCTRACLAR